MLSSNYSTFFIFLYSGRISAGLVQPLGGLRADSAGVFARQVMRCARGLWRFDGFIFLCVFGGCTWQVHQPANYAVISGVYLVGGWGGCHFSYL